MFCFKGMRRKESRSEDDSDSIISFGHTNFVTIQSSPFLKLLINGFNTPGFPFLVFHTRFQGHTAGLWS